MDDIPNIPTDDDSRYSSEDYQSELMNYLSNSSEMRNTARAAMKQAGFAGGGAILGATLGGPLGGLVGGIAGSVVGYLKSDDYDGIIVSILNLESDRKSVSTR